MNKFSSILIASVLLALMGCGGGSGNRATNVEISGVVFDVDGNVVRDAVVNVNGQSDTRSNSSGAYTLRDITGDQVIVRANVTQDGVDYYGENVAFNFSSERSKSVNITVVPRTQRATLRGTVVNNQGFPVSGASVFASAAAMISSTFTVTDSDGRFIIDTLYGNVTYDIVVGGRGFNSDSDTVNIAPGDEDDLLFTLSNETNPLLPAPDNFDAVAWTSPFEPSNRGPDFAKQKQAEEAVKRLFDPSYATRHRVVTGRNATDGSPIEVDLSWDLINSNALLGYGIYRRTGGAGQLDAIDFLRDPLAVFYADADDDLLQGQTYGYGVTALNTSFPDTNNSESDLSDVVNVVPLGGLELNSVTNSPLTFHWVGGSGATSYVIFLFPEFPHVDVDPIWDNQATPAVGTSFVYNGPGLTSGATYYYIVIGLANGNSSRTISVVDSFVAP